MREAIESAVPLRRCATRVGRRAAIVAGPPCVSAQLGVAACPCRGHVAEETYADFVGAVRRALTTEPEVALEPLEARMHRLAEAERFEEAAATRDRLDALARALQRRRTVAMWRALELLVVECDGQRIEIRRGLVAWPGDGNDGPDPTFERTPGADFAEIITVDRWVARNAGRLRVAAVEGELASALPRIAGREAAPPNAR